MEIPPHIVSVIIPVYNTAKYLPQCLDSVIAQTYPSIEIICVNDGSTDNSLEILEKYAARHSNLKIIDKVNEGVSAARNIGIKESTGEWVMFLDSDDWLNPETVETVYNAGIDYNCDIVSFDYISEFNTKSEVREYLFNNYIYKGDEFSLRILGPLKNQLNEPHKLDSMSIVCAKLYRKNIITTASFVDLKEIGTSEDTLFNYFISKKINKALYLHYPGYHYRKTNQSATTQTYKPNLIEKWDNLYDYLERLVDTPVEREAFYNRIACSLIGAGINEMKSSASFISKRKWVKDTLNKIRYKHAFDNLDLKFVSSPKWRVFFYCAKNHYYSMVTLLLMIMNEILIRKNK